MNTDMLITALARDLSPEPALTRGLWLRLAIALVIGVALVGLVLGFRPDLVAALLFPPVSGLRIVLGVMLFGIALRMALLLARPEGASLLRTWPLIAVAGLAGIAVIWALITTPVADWGRAVQGTTLFWCLSSIPVLSIAPVAAMLLTLRRGATSRPELMGAMIGLAGGGMAAAVYALHCTEVNPLFFVTWYGIAIALVAAVSSWAGARVLRW